MRYISYYTKNTPYEKIAYTYLIPSLAKFNIYTDGIIGIDSLGSWHNNTSYKPKFIWDMLNFYNEDLIFIDVDAIINQYPILFEQIPNIYDIGVHYLEWKSWYNQPHSNIKQLATGTIFIRNNEKIKTLCKEWYNLSKKENIWEQKVLQNIIDKHDINIFHLPIEYLYINSLPGNKKPYIKCNPVITHYQMSRTFKK